jgi:hypothetical protein
MFNLKKIRAINTLKGLATNIKKADIKSPNPINGKARGGIAIDILVFLREY